MFKIVALTCTFSIFLVICSCSKKHHPARTPDNSGMVKNTDSLTAKKAIVKPKPKEPVAKVISVNDNVAHKSSDGRLYYDLLGHRYWKNYKDGKYYLFNKSMYTNDAFKAQ